MTVEHIIRLPWPPADLSPNSRAHHMARARAVKKYRTDAGLMALAKGCRDLGCERLTVEITFYPPDNRRRDTDNMLASIKAGLDGIADATGVDDSQWHYGLARGEPVKGGCVLIHVIPSDSDNWKRIGDLADDMVKGAVS